MHATQGVSRVADTQWLFSYGTLRDPSVQRAVFGRETETIEDALPGFALDTVLITDPAVVAASGKDRHPILRRGSPSDSVHGAAILVSEAELAAADRYEVADYRRIPVVLASGRKAHVYAASDEHPAMRKVDGVEFLDPDPALLERLLPVARRIFSDTFASQYDARAFEAFCDDVYRPGGSMSADFANPDVRWRVAAVDRDPIGYAKLTPLRTPASNPAPGAMEMQQLYVAHAWHGTGVADRLMEWVLTTARAEGVPEIYLTVFDHNARAKRFYARYGFDEVGRCTFQLGDRCDDDRIWRLLPGR